MEKNNYVPTDKWIKVITKNIYDTLPVGMRAQVFTTTDHKGNPVEWFKDSHSNWILLKGHLNSGVIEYE